MPLDSNPTKLVLFKALRFFLVIMPVFVPFIQSNGLNLFQLFVLQSAFSITFVALEIPSGYFSDKWGRKKTLLIGSVCATIGALVYTLGSSFESFLLAEIVIGIGSAFFSGTDSALLFESLEETGKKKDYKKWSGRINLASSLSEATAALVGGGLAVISLRFPFWAWFGVSALTIPLVLSLSEPSRHHRAHPSWKDLWKMLRFAVHENKVLKWLIVFSGALGFVTLTAVWLYQPYLQLVGLPLTFFGIAWFLLNVPVGIGSFFAEHLEKKVGKKAFFWLLPFVLVACLLLFAGIAALPILVFGLVIQLIRGFKLPIVEFYMNAELSNEKRATVLSLDGLLMRLLFAVFSPLLGLLADGFGVQSSFLVLALFTLFVSLVSLWRLHAHAVL